MEQEQQENLFQEDIYDAFRHVVKALGGAKRVGSRLWPEKPAEQAGQLLMHCLNPDRAEKLDLFQIEWLLKEGNKRGCHTGISKLCTDTSYDTPKPINPEQVRDELRKETIESVKKLEQLVQRMESLDIPATKAHV